MGSVAAPVLLALVIALAVLVLSAVVSAGRPVREVLADARDALHGGLARERWTGTRPDGSDAPRRRPVLVDALHDGRHTDRDDDESSVTDLFAVGHPVPDAYVRADRFATALERAQVAVVGGVQHVHGRVRR